MVGNRCSGSDRRVLPQLERGTAEVVVGSTLGNLARKALTLSSAGQEEVDYVLGMVARKPRTAAYAG